MSINDPHLEAMMEMDERYPADIERSPEDFASRQAWVLAGIVGVLALGFVIYLVVH